MSVPFHEVRFPTGISLKAKGGPERRTQIVTLSSGHEQRNTRWADSRRRYDAGYGMRSLDDVHNVLAFFEERRGRLYGFRWKDHADFKSCKPSQNPDSGDHQIGTGDGTQVAYQLIKNYGTSTNQYVRTICKPVQGTVTIAIDGSEKSSPADYTLDASTGMISFVIAPSPDQIISAGFEFDVPVRFDTDSIEISLDAFSAGQIPDIAILEVKQ